MKALWGTLAVLAVLSIACCGGIFYMFKGASETFTGVRVEANQYASKVFPEIAKGWNSEALWKNASPDYQKSVSESSLKATFKLYQEKLGAFKEVSKFAGKSASILNKSGDLQTEVVTTAKATFEKGVADVELKVVKRKQEWKVLHFDIKSEALK